jgi:hypothetical protein
MTDIDIILISIIASPTPEIMVAEPYLPINARLIKSMER